MQAKDIMTKDLATVQPDASIREAARLMTERRLSGLPVVTADGRAIGILTASDLLHRIETGTDRRPSWFSSFFARPDELARQYAKDHGRKVHEVMSRHVVSVLEDASLSEVADVLDRNGFKRVPVTRDGVLVGIISRGDLVRVLSQTSLSKTAPKSDDSALQHAIMQQVRQQPWLNGGFVNITVKDGTVDVWGSVASAEQHKALLVLVGEVAGTDAVDDHVRVGALESLPGWV
jgi:CBS domain-containing protein